MEKECFSLYNGSKECVKCNDMKCINTTYNKIALADRIRNAEDTTEMAKIIYEMCFKLSNEYIFDAIHIKMALEKDILKG